MRINKMDELKIIKALLGVPSADSESAFRVGECLYIQSPTYHVTGRVSEIKGGFLTLVDAAWIADSGRFKQAIDNGELMEVEPVSVPVRVNLSQIIYAYDWKHPLPREQK